MMKKVLLILSLAGLMLLSSCNMLLHTPQDTLSEGSYRLKGPTGKEEEIYLEWEQENLLVYPKSEDAAETPGAVKRIALDLPDTLSDADREETSLVKPSFDLDLITILFKYRPSEPTLPGQLNSDISGALYTGYRRDHFNISYDKVPSGQFRRQVSHFGYSAGIFAGFGATAVNPWVTNDIVHDEYEGVVFSAGLAGLIGINQFTAGIAVGWDRLLDRNQKHWIYQNKPWIGATVGINLN